MFETGKHGYRELAYLLGVPDSDAPYLRTNSSSEFGFIIGLFRTIAALTIAVPGGLVWCAPVSYTHLTLPTICSV